MTRQLVSHDFASAEYSTSDDARIAASVVDLKQSDAHAWMQLMQITPQPDVIRVVYAFGIKRVIDLVCAVLLLIVLAPLLALIAALIWLESGAPIMFSQQRVGRNGELFSILKYRTMIPDRRKRSVPVPAQEERRNRHKTRNDPRVTRIGRLLRRTSLDELPQLWNIVRGEMSFIGPRPELPSIVAGYQPWQHQRHYVRPGLSGWWQVQGRSDRPMHENTELDLYYVAHQSPLLDLEILLRTFLVLIRGSGAF